MTIYVNDSDYYVLKDYDLYLHEIFPNAEINIYTSIYPLKEAVKLKLPDLLIVEADVAPPQSFMKDLTEIGTETKVYFASFSDRFAMDAINAGATGFLRKPVTKESLQQELCKSQHPLTGKIKKLFKNRELR